MVTMLIGAILLPLVAAVVLLSGVIRNPQLARWISLTISVVTLLVAMLLIAAHVDDAAASGEYVVSFDRSWLGENSPLDVRFSLGLDGISLWLFGLTAVLMVTAVLVSWQAIDHQAALFYGMLLLLECGCLGVFTARDLLLFYVF